MSLSRKLGQGRGAADYGGRLRLSVTRKLRSRRQVLALQSRMLGSSASAAERELATWLVPMSTLLVLKLWQVAAA